MRIRIDFRYPAPWWRRFGWWCSAMWRLPRAWAVGWLLVGVLVLTIGLIYHHCACQFSYNFIPADWRSDFDTLYPNFATTFLGTALAVLTIERVVERRDEKHRKEQLIRQMRNPDNGIVLQAVDEIRAHSDRFWDDAFRNAHLTSANLQGADLIGEDLQRATLLKANLRGADLSYTKLYGASLIEADLQGANLIGAELQGARLRDANLRGAHLCDVNLDKVRGIMDKQLVTVFSLCGATMPNGRRYDGRFNLSGDTDVEYHNMHSRDEEGGFEYAYPSAENYEALARWYGVSVEDYRAGQKWADENLARVSCEAGLEEPPIAAPTSVTQRPKRALVGGNLSGWQHTAPKRHPKK